MAIELQQPRGAKFALFELGFRPFFSAAGLFAVVSVLVWMALYVFAAHLPMATIAPMYWHAHEMIYGYVMAVVAGFLLTAVGNWTGVRTFSGSPLAMLLLLWLVGRIAFFLPMERALLLAAGADLLFMIGLIVGVSLPVIKVRQWKQLGIVSKLLFMLFANGLFYAGLLGYAEQGVRWGLYLGLYLILALIFVMARRVIPFFIERGVAEQFSARNRLWLDVSSLVLFTAWAVLDIFTQQSNLVAWLSAALFAIHLWRLRDWYTPGIWKVPLLWSLYVAYGSLAIGFLLKALSIWQSVAPQLAVHAFAFGGIGLMTIGMMSRVALGHTGRDVARPPALVSPVFALLIAGAIFRVLLPAVVDSHYTLWIAVSQVLWIAGFAMFCVVYIPMLIKPRIDGRPGLATVIVCYRFDQSVALAIAKKSTRHGAYAWSERNATILQILIGGFTHSVCAIELRPRQFSL